MTARSLRNGQPLWLDQPSQARRFPSYRGHTEVDVVILGGGITGAICAYVFSEAGIRLALLESKKVARGSTAASTALLMQEPDRDFSDLARRFGARDTREIWVSLSRATRDLVRTIRKLKLRCDLHERESVYFTLDSSRVAALRKEYETRKAAGLPGRWLSAAALHRMTGINGQAAIVTPGNAQVSPMRACHGFLAAAVTRGAKVFEGSPAIGIKVSADGVVVRTSGGTVAAKVVVIATGYTRAGLEPRVGRFAVKDTYVIATRQLPARLRRQIPRSQTMGWDTDRPYHYLRWTRDGRLLVGGEDTSHRSTTGSRARIAKARGRLLSYLAQVYPVLVGERPAYAWEGLFIQTPDGLPYIGTHSRHPRHLFALGYGGNGMTASFLAATRLLAHYRTIAGAGRTVHARDLFAFNRGRS